MVVPFGFSVGDIIAGIGVIKNSIEAFSDTRGATKDHKLLCDTLTGLCASLEAVRGLDIDHVHDARQIEATRQAVDQCQMCIDDFVCRITKYKIIQPSIQPLSWESRVKAAAKKIQWALLKQGDLSKFKTDVELQFNCISVLLLSFQVHRQRRQVSVLDSVTASQAEALNISRGQTDAIQELKIGNGEVLDRAEEQLSIARDTQGLIQALKTSMSEGQCFMLQQILQQQASHYQSLVESQSRSHRLLHQQSRNVQLIANTQSQTQLLMSSLNASIAQITLNNGIPPQVLLQRPLVFRDALDRVTPVHLDFIDSAEAFLAVLKIRFKEIGSEKLDRNEYTLTDDKQNRNLDMKKPWCSVMKPGQHVSMSMIFDTRFQQNICPGCSATNETQNREETTCVHCSLTYRLFEETIVRNSPLSTDRLHQESSKRQSDARHSETRDKSAIHAQDFGSTSEVTITDFRRVHLINRVERGFVFSLPTQGPSNLLRRPGAKPIEPHKFRDVRKNLRRYRMAVMLKDAYVLTSLDSSSLQGNHGSRDSSPSRTFPPSLREASYATGHMDFTDVWSQQDWNYPEPTKKAISYVFKTQRALFRYLGSCLCDCRKRKVECSLSHHSLEDILDADHDEQSESDVQWALLIQRP
ncbi:hypothetical protein VE04_05188 [Pseudogymnoascus sp. 24MN13]|nr:hypothetical protein VE04_05188 [Pseudogymnoascus sp. 24MN13]